jgi:DNA-binding transcriptional ArsR family regulator/uncharacterized protein YndB with AHSA1/START domain
VDAVFKALADTSRRRLLDLLRERDGRTLADLCSHLPHMTRFGVASHLAVLQDAGLITAVRAGREKHHYLNAVPLREVAGRWLSEFSAAQADALLALRTHLEEPTLDTVYRIQIRCAPQALWDALTENDRPRPWMWGTIATGGWETGGHWAMSIGPGEMIVGDVIEANPPTHLRTTFDPRWNDEVAAEAPGELEYRIRDLGNGVCELTVAITGLGGASAADTARDTPEIYSGLKTLLETGVPLSAAK